MNVIKELKTTKDRIKEVLRTDERARNSDLWLTFQIWRNYDKVNFYIPYNRLTDLTSMETIRRQRQVIQNKECLYLPTDEETKNKRKQKESVFYRYFGGLNVRH